MVFAVMLSHGRYVKEHTSVPDVKVPYNIRLILYTNPQTDLSPNEADYILRQVLDKHKLAHKIYEFTLKPEVLATEYDETEFTVKSPPYLKRKAKKYPYPNDKREIGQEYAPLGKFKIYEANTTTPNIELEFKSDFRNFDRSYFGDPKIVVQTQAGSTNIETHRQESISYFLKELSCFYEKEFPGKIVNVIQLSCRSDR